MQTGFNAYFGTGLLFDRCRARQTDLEGRAARRAILADAQPDIATCAIAVTVPDPYRERH